MKVELPSLYDNIDAFELLIVELPLLNSHLRDELPSLQDNMDAFERLIDELSKHTMKQHINGPKKFVPSVSGLCCHAHEQNRTPGSVIVCSMCTSVGITKILSKFKFR